MIFFSIGLPGRLAEWCDAVLANLAGRRDGSVAVTTCPPIAKMFGYESITCVLDEVTLSLIETNATHLIVGARQPDERLCAMLDATNARFVVALDDPRFAVADLATIIWPRELFIVNGNSGKRTTDVLEISGSACVAPLIYGPDIHLPPGSWTARVLLGFSSEAVGRTFLVDACAGRQLACTSFQPGKAGVYTADINFSLDKPSGHGLEIRVWGSDYAQGPLAFGHVILRPLAMRQPDAILGSQDDFRSVLDL